MEYDALLSAQELIESIEWIDQIPGQEEVLLNRMARLLDRLTSEQRIVCKELFLSLMVVKEYNKHELDLASIVEKGLENKNVTVSPVKAPGDEGKIKSGHGVSYAVGHYMKTISPKLSIKILDSIGDARAIEGQQLVLVDDFVGTGDTLKKMRNGSVFNGRFPDETLVATIVIQDRALEFLKKEGIRCCYIYRRGRAFSPEYYDSQEQADASGAVYDAIEERLQVFEEYKRGYRGSEGLEILKRTPNNALPLFWLNKAKGGDEWPAPFPR